MLFRNKKLTRLFVVSAIIAVIIPVLNIFLVYPHVTRVLFESVEDSAVRLARHAERSVENVDGWQRILDGKGLNAEMDKILHGYLSDFNLMKIKIFSPAGLAVYSTDAGDIGVVNENPFFHKNVAMGETYSKVVRKEALSLEGQAYERDVVEVYVPYLDEGRFLGAFELYYDITGRIERLDRLVAFGSIAPFVASGLLLIVLFWGMRNLDVSLIARREAEKEVRALQGTIPICMHCKQIRDEDGAWEQLEKYIMDRSDAQFSHGLCGKCAKDVYGKEVES